MNEVSIQNLNDFVMLADKSVKTDSRRVAKHFGKRHDNVLRSYDGVECSEEFNRLNFEVVQYLDAKGELRREVHMTKDGFMFLVMGFTGKKAAQIKEAFIRAFNAMADYIKSAQDNLWAQRLALECRDASSKVRASFGSHLMLERKRELPLISRERVKLASDMQISLPLLAA